MLYSQNAFGLFPFERSACLHRQFIEEFIKPPFAWVCECLPTAWPWNEILSEKRALWDAFILCTWMCFQGKKVSYGVKDVVVSPSHFILAPKQHWGNSWGFWQFSVSSSCVFSFESFLSKDSVMLWFSLPRPSRRPFTISVLSLKSWLYGRNSPSAQPQHSANSSQHKTDVFLY